MAEDGWIPRRYPLRELADAGYPERTRQNVIESDGTLIVFSRTFDGGTALTATLCKAERRPVCLLDAAVLTAADARQHTTEFIQNNAIKVLNVAGPRASKWPEGHAYVYELISAVLTTLAG